MMNDHREHVIQALKEAIPFMENRGYGGVANTIFDALELLKQEPVIVRKCKMKHMLFWRCGSCGVLITEGDKFCRMCGRAVKWE